MASAAASFIGSPPDKKGPHQCRALIIFGHCKDVSSRSGMLRRGFPRKFVRSPRSGAPSYRCRSGIQADIGKLRRSLRRLSSFSSGGNAARPEAFRAIVKNIVGTLDQFLRAQMRCPVESQYGECQRGKDQLVFQRVSQCMRCMNGSQSGCASAPELISPVNMPSLLVNLPHSAAARVQASASEHIPQISAVICSPSQAATSLGVCLAARSSSASATASGPRSMIQSAVLMTSDGARSPRRIALLDQFMQNLSAAWRQSWKLQPVAARRGVERRARGRAWTIPSTVFTRCASQPPRAWSLAGRPLSVIEATRATGVSSCLGMEGTALKQVARFPRRFM